MTFLRPTSGTCCESPTPTVSRSPKDSAKRLGKGRITLDELDTRMDATQYGQDLR